MCPAKPFVILVDNMYLLRQEDSINLWKDICSNKLLAKAIIILFFNKVQFNISPQ